MDKVNWLGGEGGVWLHCQIAATPQHTTFHIRRTTGKWAKVYIIEIVFS